VKGGKKKKKRHLIVYHYEFVHCQRKGRRATTTIRPKLREGWGEKEKIKPFSCLASDKPWAAEGKGEGRDDVLRRLVGCR